MIHSSPTSPVAPPETMSADEIELARQQASALVRGVRESTGGQQLAVLDEVTSVGLESQRNAGRQLELVKTRLATFLDEGGAEQGGRARADRPARRARPHQPRRSSSAASGARTLGAAALHARQRDGPGAEEDRAALRAGVEADRRHRDEAPRGSDAARPATTSSCDASTRTSRRSSRRSSARRSSATLLLHELTELLAETDDPLERDRIQAAVHDVATRLQDLHAMQEVHLQYFVSIELTRQNNNRLGQAVDRTLTLATNVVTVGLAIQAALVRQARVKEATERTREFLGEMIVQNAAGHPAADRRDR